MSDAVDDPVPRDVLALIALHGLLSRNTPDQHFDFSYDVIDGYAQMAFAFADAMKQQAEATAATLRAAMGMVTESEVCALLGITLGTARNRQSAGDFPPHYSVGQAKLFKLAEVEAWIKRRRGKKVQQ